MRIFWLVALTLCSLVTPAVADSHVDLSFAFLSGQRGYDNATFGYTEGTASPSLGGTFRAQPFSGVSVAGPSGEATLVVDNVRFVFGMQAPYARLTMDQETMALAGSPLVQVHGLDIRELRFGLGYEYRLAERVTVFADLMGTADRVVAKLTVGDDNSSYESKNFGYSARLGGRYAINRHYYVHGSVEVGMGGNIDAGGYVGVGVRVP